MIFYKKHFQFYYIHGLSCLPSKYANYDAKTQVTRTPRNSAPPAAPHLVRSAPWSRSVPLTSVHGETVSTPAALGGGEAAVGFVIRRCETRMLGESAKSWAGPRFTQTRRQETECCPHVGPSLVVWAVSARAAVGFAREGLPPPVFRFFPFLIFFC